MGITGLIPFLEKASTSVNLKQLQGSSVAVDSYCWLHKGVFACAEKLIRGEATNIHIQYCLKYVDMLIRNKIKVIMVFDGRHLPAKAETERRRREARNESKKLAKEYLRRNEIEKARSHMRRAVDVTHEMALELIKACRDRGVECIVAPYEADAQMAWLNIQGLAEFIITEDSDLTLFGAKKILFKLDLLGKALLVESSKLYLAMGCKPEKYTFDKFRRMCILSGCDYLDSLQGIGLKKACKFMLITEEDDMTKSLKKLPKYLNMKQLEVTENYIESFLKAEATFKHMFIYNPLERRMERLNDIEELQTELKHCSNAGCLLEDDDQAFQLALGNLNPFTLKQLDDWHPDRDWTDTNRKSLKHKSIWKRLMFIPESNNHNDDDIKHTTKLTKEVSILEFRKIEFKNMAEMEMQENITEEKSKLEEAEVFSMYKYESPSRRQLKKRKRQPSTSSDDEDSRVQSAQHSQTPSKSAHNPFAKHNASLEGLPKSPICTNNSLLRLLSPKKVNEVNRKQQIERLHVALNKPPVDVKSRFFADNIKQVVKKPFAARDLTAEMFKIEEKLNTSFEQNKQIFYNSPPMHKTKISPQQQQDPSTSLKINENSASNCIIEDENRNEIMNLEKFNDNSNGSKSDSEIVSLNKFQENEREASPNGNIEEEVILLSDIDEDNISQQSSSSSIQKLQNGFSNSRKIGMSKPKKKTNTTPRKTAKMLTTNDTKQQTLSMFGFQKRPTLKK